MLIQRLPFLILVNKARIISKTKELWNNSFKTIDIIGTLKGAAMAERLFHDYIKRCLERGVRIRLIDGELENEFMCPQIWKSLKIDNLMLRYTRCPIKVSVGIHDGKEALFYLAPTAEKMPPPSLFSNNPSFVKMCQDYFEQQWEKAQEYWLPSI